MTKVLVVDDSALMRRYLRGILEERGRMDVVTARNGVDALEQIRREQPDVVTLDINMPEMDGLDCLGHIMADSPRPVVMVSSLTSEGAIATLEALELGAVDYVEKPGGTVSLNIRDVGEEIVEKVTTAAGARVRGARGARGITERIRRRRAATPGAAARLAGTAAPGRGAPAPSAGVRPAVIVVGASTGGPGVLEQVLAPLPADFPVPIVIAQHIPASFSGHLAARLDTRCAVRVAEVSEARLLEPGLVLIGRGDADVVLTKRGGAIAARSVPNDPSLAWHPSVERLVRTAMTWFDPKRVVAVQLTGMGDDGADAIADLHRQGGRTIAESEETAIVNGMPGEVVRRGAATAVLPIGAVAAELMRWA